jgi:hypothetical protein
MGTSIRGLYCEHCKKHTPHILFSSLAGKLFKCLICNKERIEEPEHD